MTTCRCQLTPPPSPPPSPLPPWASSSTWNMDSWRNCVATVLKGPRALAQHSNDIPLPIDPLTLCRPSPPPLGIPPLFQTRTAGEAAARPGTPAGWRVLQPVVVPHLPRGL
eukprot:365297-Chlamydomonas_euryale.AAC.4